MTGACGAGGARRVALAFALATVLAAAGARPLDAQRPAEPGQRARAAAPARAQMEQRLRQRLAGIVRTELGLDDAQARQLGEVSGRYEQQRRALARRERELRLQLRGELQGGESASQERVAGALDRLLGVQRERLAIVEQEQRDLAKFLTPTQRAKYLVLQDQVRRRLEEARRAREDRAPAAGRRLRPGATRP